MTMQGPRVLIVDDEAIVRESLAEWLESRSYRVTAVDDGELALAYIVETDYDIVLLDIRLARKSGVDVLREAKKYKPNLKAIMITGYPSVDTAVETMKLGAVDYLVKPFEPEALEQRIEEALRPKAAYAIITKPALSRFVTSLLGVTEVVGVTKKDGRFSFEKLNRADDLVLDYDVTLLPPKKYFLPQIENILRFKLGGSFEATAVTEATRRVIIGVHPDDLAAIELLDEAFMKVNPDPYYVARRQNTYLIAVDNLHPSPNAFCPSVGTAIPEKGFDLLLTDIGDEYLITIGTSRGKELLAGHADSGEASDIDVVAARAEQGKALKRYALSLAVPVSELPSLLERNYDSSYWETKAENCLSCGSCVMVCPTCFCFDVQDQVTLDLKEGWRWRRWDGCVLTDFARVATGENFRHDRASRLRHRIMRKGKYIIERYHLVGCVGCGRCGSACLTDIASPLKVFNELKEQ